MNKNANWRKLTAPSIAQHFRTSYSAQDDWSGGSEMRIALLHPLLWIPRALLFPDINDFANVVGIMSSNVCDL